MLTKKENTGMRYFILIYAIMICLLLIIPYVSADLVVVSPSSGSQVYQGDTLNIINWTSGGIEATKVKYYAGKNTGGTFISNTTTYNELSPYTADFIIPSMPSDYNRISYSIFWSGNWYGQESSRYWIFNSTILQKINIIFSISENGDFSKKISGALVTISNGQSNTTDINGNCIIKLTPASGDYTYTVIKSGYQNIPDTNLGAYGLHDSNILLEMNVETNEYYITVSPAWIPNLDKYYLYGQIHKQGVNYINLSEINVISWSWHKMGLNGVPNGAEHVYYETLNSDNGLYYSRQDDGNYKGYQLSTQIYSNDKGGALPNPVSLNPVGQTGSILTTLKMVDNLGRPFSFSVSNLIGGSQPVGFNISTGNLTTGNMTINNITSNNVHFIVQDAYTGYPLSLSKISVRDDTKNTWQNTSVFSSGYDMSFDVGSHLTIIASSSGYTTLTKSITVEINSNEYINMYESNAITESGRANLFVYTRSSPTGSISSQPLNGVFVIVTNTSYPLETYSGYSDSSGKVVFIVNASRPYKITATTPNYLSSTTTINTGIINPFETYLYLTSVNVFSPTPTQPTPYPTQTSSQNIKPVVTPKSWTNESASICGVYDNSSILSYFKSQIACNGFETGISQSLLIAGIIILICVAYGAKYGKGVGAAIGGLIGFVLSFALGVIPFMILALILVLLTLVIAILILSKVSG
jgi:hypothetical protein